MWKETGISLGSAIAVTISWSLNKSVLWVIIHGILGWVYVIYYILFCRGLHNEAQDWQYVS